MVHYNSALNLSHFEDPQLLATMRDVFAPFVSAIPHYPAHGESAKAWEISQAVRGLRDHGALRPDAELLGVAAGWEHTVYYLTSHVRRVFSTDLYATNEDWREADNRMLFEPEAFAPAGLPWRPDRLVVQHMDALNLKYEDNSFDGIFSCGSIEHFGSFENVERSVQEMARVLKPGGIATLSTEFRISGPDGIGIPGAILFTPEMIRAHVIEASGLTPVDDVDFGVDEETASYAYPILEAISNGIRPRSICLTHEGYCWTSIALCLRKD